MSTIPQIKDGECWVMLRAGEMRDKHKEVCCDCGLAHNLEIERAADGEIIVRVSRNSRTTALVRRHGKTGLQTEQVKGWEMNRRG